MTRPIAIDLFAGAGGMSLGFEQAGFDIVAAIDIDPVHCAVHSFNFPNNKSICANTGDLTGDEIRELARIEGREVDVVFGGAPCQGFSMIGKRALEDPRNSLVRDFSRLVFELGARYFVFENVKGLTVGKHKKFLEEIIEEFQKNGYELTLPYSVLNAANFGVPQDRRRLFLMGAKGGLPLPSYPDPITRPHKDKGKIAKGELPFGPSVWDAIGDLPEVEEFAELEKRDWVETEFGELSEYARAMRGVKIRGQFT